MLMECAMCDYDRWLFKDANSLKGICTVNAVNLMMTGGCTRSVKKGTLKI